MAQGRLPVGHVVSGRYQVAAQIGAGEMGEVYDVRDTSSGFAYALKLLGAQVGQSREACSALEREARKATDLGLDIVAKAYEFGVEPQTGAAFMLGELVLLPSLRQMVLTQGPLTIQALEVILRTLAPALDKAHQAGAFHRALKPSNIFAAQTDAATWQVRVTDFGIASARLIAPPPPGWTATPGWLSAEQADPSSAPNPTMDIYALGLTAFFALTGNSAFRSAQSDAPDLNQLWAEMTAPLPPASARARELGGTLSPTLDPWFARALAVSPSQRFKTVGEMAQALWSLVGSAQHVITMRPPPGVPAAPSGPAAPIAPSPSEIAPPSGVKGRQQTLMYGEPGMPPPPPPVPPTHQVPRPILATMPAAALGVAPPYNPAQPPEEIEEDDDELPTRAMTREQFEAGGGKLPDLESFLQGSGAQPPDPEAARLLQPVAPQSAMTLPTNQMRVEIERQAMRSGLDFANAQEGQAALAQAQIGASTAPPKRGSALLIPLAAGGGVLFVGMIIILVVAFVRTRTPETPQLPESSVKTAATDSSKTASSSAPSASASTAVAAPDASAPKDAALKLSCDPECDEIKCDGKPYAKGDSGMRLEPGKHSCVGTKKGYVARTETIELKAGDDITKTMSLDKLPTGGGATSESKPPSTTGTTTTAKPPATTKPPTKKSCGTFLNPCK